jgi:hypothetical protein
MLSGFQTLTFGQIWYPTSMRAVPTVAPTFSAGFSNLQQGISPIGTGNATIFLQADGLANGVFAVTLNAGCTFDAEL